MIWKFGNMDKEDRLVGREERQGKGECVDKQAKDHKQYIWWDKGYNYGQMQEKGEREPSH